MADNDLNVQWTEQSTEDVRPDIGVLFVHGIGSQRRGQTLAEFGEPIYLWLRDRFSGLDRQWREAISNHPQQQELKEWRFKVEVWANDGFRADQCVTKRDPELLAQLAKRLRCDTVVGRVQPDRCIDLRSQGSERASACHHAVAAPTE